jgi:hypothetical protein
MMPRNFGLGGRTSLTVSPNLLEQATRGPVSDDDFIACIRDSLPYAWSVVTDVAERLASGAAAFADNQQEPPGSLFFSGRTMLLLRYFP